MTRGEGGGAIVGEGKKELFGDYFGIVLNLQMVFGKKKTCECS